MKINKELIIYVIIIILLIIGIITSVLSLQNQNTTINNTQKKIKKLKGNIKDIDFINEMYINRYIKYQKNNPDLDIEDIITRVNIGLDKKYYTNTKSSKYLNKNYILTNKYTYLKEDYVPENLEYLDTTYSRNGMMLVKEAKKQLELMITAAKNENIKIRVISSYRSYKYQVQLYNRYIEEDGKDLADTYSARPGFSEHQTGLCIDIDDSNIDYNQFDKSPSYKWMQNNAHLFGYIERYPKGKEEITGYTYESWHYRYVGKKIAKYIKKHNITFDEYYVKFIENKEE
ncbi:MAG: M15 family metallopeptidase [Bacilli bacterium]|nr:M15 family metallopeptidase [Bacilli bacterium]